MLDANEIAELEVILFDDQWTDEALDFFGLHGAICASVIGPRPLSTTDMFALATAQESVPDNTVPDLFVQAVDRLSQHIASTLESGEPLSLPEPEDDDPLNALENWCAGFIDAFMQQEALWLEAGEEEVAAMMVPIMALSGLFEDEEFQKLLANDEMAMQMADAIPEAVTDIYLLYHTMD